MNNALSAKVGLKKISAERDGVALLDFADKVYKVLTSKISSVEVLTGKAWTIEKIGGQHFLRQQNRT
jgi:hypothetical protein